MKANSQAFTDSSEFRTEIMEKIQQIAARSDHQRRVEDTDGDMRQAVGKVLERFQREIIQRSIWVRIYDDHASQLPVFDPQACRMVEKIIENALLRHQAGRMLAYVEISFLINETGTVVTVEDNASSLSIEQATHLGLLRQPSVTTLASGYTLQAALGNDDDSRELGQASVRCVTDCFTRFTVCFPH